MAEIGVHNVHVGCPSQVLKQMMDTVRREANQESGSLDKMLFFSVFTIAHCTRAIRCISDQIQHV